MSDAAVLTSQLSVCIDDVSSWMMANRLQLNPIKIEVLCCSSASRQHQISTGPVRIGSISVQPVSAVRDLGVFIDADLTLKSLVTATVRACFAALDPADTQRSAVVVT